MHDQPLNSADFDFIEDTLLKYGDDHSVLNPSELDGYFTALVSSPAPVDIALWFPASGVTRPRTGRALRSASSSSN